MSPVDRRRTPRAQEDRRKIDRRAIDKVARVVLLVMRSRWFERVVFSVLLVMLVFGREDLLAAISALWRISQ